MTLRQTPSLLFCLLLVELSGCGIPGAPRPTGAPLEVKRPIDCTVDARPKPTVAETVSQPRGYQSLVAADHAIASRVGASMLKAGGDAVDAAVATALALGVVHPFASGIGGGGFAVVFRSKSTPMALDFREVAPRKAHRDMYLDASGQVKPGASTYGPLAAGVPGELAGLWTLHQRYGKLPWKDVVEPARKLAFEGFPVGMFLHEKISQNLSEIRQSPLMAAVFLDGKGQPIEPGATLKQTNLGRTLAAVAEKGVKTFYQGEVAQKLVAAIQAAGGLIDQADLRNYKVRHRNVIQSKAMGYEFLAMPPPSSGGAVILQALKALDGIDLKAMGHNSADYLHRLTEAMKHGFADRARVMGDPDFVPVPIKDLISDVAAQRVKDSFDPQKTLKREAYGEPRHVGRDGGTSHFSVIDGSGNAVALTTTVNTTFASQFIAGETGVLMNNEMDDFVARPGTPNAYGLIGQASNAIQPGKRPLSSMSPTIVTQENRPVLVVGGSGGPTIISSTLQVILNTLSFGMDIESAIRAPRIHHQWVPNTIFVEDGTPNAVLKGLQDRGHKTQVRTRFSAVQGVMVSPGGMTAASDPSKRGKPAGVMTGGQITTPGQ